MSSWEVRDATVVETPTKRLGLPVSPMLSPAHDAALLRSLAAMLDDPAGSPPPYPKVAPQPSTWAVSASSALAMAPANENVGGKVRPRERRAPRVHCVVEFKLGRRGRVVCPPELQGHVIPSTYVIVELAASKTLDAAICVSAPSTTMNAMNTLNGMNATNPSTAMSTPSTMATTPSSSCRPPRGGAWAYPDVGTIVRVATAADCAVINSDLPQWEERAMGECRRLIHFLHLPFECVDTEATFDGAVVRVHYVLAPQSSTTVVPNVSRLQRELSFSLKARVILEQRRSIY